MPNEYSITYTYNDGTNHGMSGGSSSIASTAASWTKSGETSRKVGEVTKIVCTRYFSTDRATGSMKAHCTLTCGSKVISSDSYSAYPLYSNKFTFTWNATTVASLTDADTKTWTLGVQVDSGLPAAGLYWRAHNGCPVKLTFYFYDWNDLVGNSKPPSMTSSNIAISGANSGVYLRNFSNVTITGSATTDTAYNDTLVNTYTLTLTQGGKQIYSNIATATGNAKVTFNVGKISTAGAVTVKLSLRDNAGRTASTQASFTVIDYTSPAIAALSGTNGVDRCKQVQDQYGTNQTWVLANDGNYVELNIRASVCAVTGKSNSGQLTLVYGTGTTAGTSGTTKNLGTVSAGVALTKTKDHSVITGTFDVNQNYWFKFSLTDSFGVTTTKIVYINKMESIFNIEPYGVAVGQLSTGTSASKKFECAYPAFFNNGATITNPTFKGTITGISTSVTYKSGEMDTGNKWIDGKPIYIAIYDSGTAALTKNDTEVDALKLAYCPDTVISLQTLCKIGTNYWQINTGTGGKWSFYAYVYTNGHLKYRIDSTDSNVSRIVMIAYYTRSTTLSS